ncbi:sensor histidine kinase [Streptomyces sp. NPDC001020]
MSLGTGLLGVALLYLVVIVFVLCLVGTGFLLLPSTLRLLRRYANFHRGQVGRLTERPLQTTYRDQAPHAPPRSRPSLRDPAVRKDLVWLPAHAIPGSALCLLTLSVCGRVANWLTTPLWWKLAPGERDAILALTVDSWGKAVAALFVGLVGSVIAMRVTWLLARAHGEASRWLLTARPQVRLDQRVRELAASRAEALDAHAAELRRIERDLHDGAQAGIVAVSLRLGMIKRALAQRPEQVPEMVEATQQLTEQALKSLRNLVRGIYPPVLADRGLVDAVRTLAALSEVPVRIDADGTTDRAPAAVETAAYFVVSEALANVAKHSGAQAALVWLRITEKAISIRIEDDGRGGASADAGGGILGLKRRVAAFDGTTELVSPHGGPTVLKVEIPCGS